MDIIDKTPERNTTQQELQQYPTVRERIQQLDTSNTFDSTDPNQRLFFVSFDGTRNDRENDDPGTIHTNPDLLEQLVPQLDNVVPRYFPGVGTRTDNLIEEIYQSATGKGSEARAEAAYRQLEVQVQEWHNENQNLEIHVSTAGFSRGTGSQRHFANLVHERGIPDPDGDGYLIPPGGVHQDVMLIYDSVVTGQENVLELDIPEGVIAVHLTADHENRTSFDLASIVDPSNPNDSGILEAGLPGSHSDLGGNYGYGGLSARSLELGHTLLELMGVPVKEIPEEYAVDATNTAIHDSGILDLSSVGDAFFSFGNWEFGEREVDTYGNPDRLAEQISPLDTLYREDGSVAMLGDPEGLWLIEFNRDGSGTVTIGQNEDQKTTPFKNGDQVELASNSEGDVLLDIHQSTSGTNSNNLIRFATNGQGEAVVSVKTTPEDNVTVNIAGEFESTDPPSVYTIQQGDTLSQIAERYNTSVEHILENNPNIPGRDTIRAGDILELTLPSIESEQGNTNHSAEPVLQAINDYLENTNHFYRDNNPNLFTLYPDGRIVESLSIASTDGGSAQSRTINGDNLPTTREKLMTQLEEAGVSRGEAERMAGNANVELLAANESGEGWINEDLFQDVAADFWADTDLNVQGQKVEAQAPKADLNNEFLNLTSSRIDLRDAINSGNGWDIAREGAGYAVSLDSYSEAQSGDGFLGATGQAIVSGIEHGIGLGQAINEGDGWGIAGNSIDLLRSIDDYTNHNGGDFISGDGRNALNIASSGFALAEAIEGGDGWGIAQSTSSLLQGIDSYNGNELSAGLSEMTGGADVIGGTASAIGLAANIASFEDVWESGDELAIAQTTASTINNAANLYSSISGSGFGGLGNVGGIPVISWVTAGIQLAQGDVRGASVTLAAAAAVAYIPVYGWIVAAVLVVVDMLIGDDPPSATADFVLDADGNIIMDVRGDSDMKESVESAGAPLIAVLQNYKDTGGRVNIDGSLPSLRIEAGKDPEIRYTSEYGGKVVISVGDRSRLGLDMRGALYARDRGDRVDDAVKTARDSSGNIDFSKVDAALAAMGFSKRGMTYTYGESYAPRIRSSYGNGVYAGGGNANGPQGQHFTASDKDIKSLPLTPDQRPSQTIGKILRSVSVKHNFAGASGLLLAMGLGLDIDQACASALYGQVKTPESNTDYIKPLDAVALDAYLQSGSQPDNPQQQAYAYDNDIPAVEEDGALQPILSSHLPGLNSDFSPLDANSDIDIVAQTFGSSTPLPTTFHSNYPEWWKELSADVFHGPDEQYTPNQEPVSTLPSNNIQISEAQLPEGFEAPLLPQGMAQGVYFSMVQDSSLRFLPATLSRQSVAPYSSSTESYTLLSYSNAQHGTVYEDANGDLRFAADEGFVGTASFEYTLLGPDGETITHRALIVVEDLNDAPELSTDQFIINEGDSFYLDQLLNNDHDADGDSINIDHIRGLEHGTITLVDNRLLFTPEEGFTGTLNFSYLAHDGSYPQRGTASLTILDQNLGAVPTDDRFIILEDQSLLTTAAKLLANDHEYDGEAIQLTGVHSAQHGQVSMDASGNITFIPDSDYAGTEAGFSYTVSDQSGNLSTGYAAIEVLDLREAPQVSSNTYPAINEDETISFCPEEIAKFVSDADGDQLHLDFITNIQHGTVIVENGFFTFIPEDGFSGTASFDYQANDNHRGTVQGHLEFEVLPVNDAIVTGANSFQTQEETPLLVTVDELLANDTDPEGGSVSFVSVGEAEHGTVSIDADDNITFTPSFDYSGEEAGFSYTVIDDEGLRSTAFVKVDVVNSNDAPTVVSDTITSNEDQDITFDAATIERFLQDSDGDSLSFSNVTNVTGGTVTENNGIFTFSPDANYHGAASLDYSATDNNGGTVSGTLQIDILSVDDATIFGADTLTTDEEVSVSTTVAELLANDSDVEGPLSFVGLGAAFHGTVSQDVNGIITFTPEADYSGNDAGFEYTVADTGGNQSSTMVQVGVAAVNDAPQIIGADISTNEDQAIVFDNDTIEQFVQDRDGDSLTISAISNISGGIVTENNGLYTFTPDSDYHGDATLDYTVDDGHGGTVSGPLHIDILSINDATDFGDDTLNTDEEVAVSTTIAELMVNDSDTDGALTFAGLGAVFHGTLNHAENGDIIFTPDMDYSGTDAGFEYTVEDAEGNRETSMVQVQVAAINDVPVIVHDQRNIDEDQGIIFSQAEMASFIHDPDGDQLSFTSLSAVTGGSFSQDNGIYTFTPDTDFYGSGQFNYTVSDGQGVEVSSIMTIHIAPVNDLPQIASTTATMLEDGEITFDVSALMAGASDIEDGTDLRFMGIAASSNGDGWVDENGLLHFLPNDDFFGTASLSYSVADTEAGMGTGLITVTVLGENDAPLAMDDDRILAWSNNSYENVYSSAVLLTNDSDVDGDAIQIGTFGNAEYGTVSQDANGYIHYRAISDDWVGIDTVTYTISDGNGGESQATATIDVKLNTSPDAYSEILFTQEDIINIIDQETLLANDSDVDGDTLFISAVGNATHGTVTLRSDGEIVFTPELNFNNRYPGQASFEYTVSDGISDPVTAVAFVDLDPVNDAPILVPERINGAIEDNSFSFTAAQLMTNDYDVEMDSAYENDSIAFVGVIGAAHGSLSYDSGTDQIYYNPNANFCGVETFQYQVTDSFGAISTGTSEIYVQPVNDNPVAQEDIASPAETLIWNKYSIAGLVSNDYDVDGDSLTIVNPFISSGSANVKIESGYLWVQPSGGERHVEVSYTVSDGHGGTAPSRLIMNQIAEHNFAPELAIGSVGWSVDTSAGLYDVNFSIIASDRNQGDIVTVSAAQVSNGTVTKYSNSSFDWNGFLTYGTPGPPSSFTLTAVDQGGASGTVYIQMWGGTEPGLGYYDYTFRYAHSPVVLDLDGDGVELLGIEEGVTFDWNRDTIAESSGWVAADDGFLVYDHNHDRAVTRADELILKEYLPGATTDLEGLAAFDSNNDGIFSKEDESWADFGVWQDKNSDGISGEGEFLTLDEAGIKDIELESDGNEREITGNTVFGSTVYHREDGSSAEVGDVALRGEDLVLKEVSAEEESTTEPETEFEMTEAEVNRIAQQLQSDAAAGPNASGTTGNTTAESIVVVDSTDDYFQQPDDIEDDTLAIAA